jgi:hypothetical protein
MATVAARIELESQQLKFEAASKVWVALPEARWHGKTEEVAPHSCSLSLAQRRSAEPVCWPVQAPASLAPAPVKRLTGRCARNERRKVKSSNVSATKGWQRIGRSNTMR